MSQFTREHVLATLHANGNAADVAALYADSYLEYQEAMANIAKNGAICANPRTGQPMENPYCKIRDKSFAKMRSRGLSRVKSDGLW